MDLTDIYAEIFKPIDTAPVGRPLVIAQIGQSLDGRVATVTGDANNVSGPAGLDHLHRLRAKCDAVLVGAGTVRADNPQLTVRRVPGNSPARAVIDPRGRLSDDASWMRADGAQRIHITSGTALKGCDAAIRLDSDSKGRIAPGDIVAALFSRGLRIILVEGGPTTLSQFVDAGCLDRLHVFVSPIIIGSGKPSLDLSPIKSLAAAIRPATRVFQFGNEVLFDCDLRS